MNYSSGKAAVFGSPISHSLSPVVHRQLGDAAGIEIDYDAREVTEQTLVDHIDIFLEDDQWNGVSVTMPLKREIVSFSEPALNQQEVNDLKLANTLVKTSQALVAFNTDIHGINRALGFHGYHGYSMDHWLILGAGATAQSALAAAVLQGVKHITIAVRDFTKAAAIQEQARRSSVQLKLIELSALDWEHLMRHRVCISTLPGKAGNPIAQQLSYHLEATDLLNDHYILDVSYSQDKSALAQLWNRHGGTALSGKYMLVFQAVEQFKLFFSEQLSQKFSFPADDYILEKAALKAVDL